MIGYTYTRLHTHAVLISLDLSLSISLHGRRAKVMLGELTELGGCFLGWEQVWANQPLSFVRVCVCVFV